MHPSAFPDLPVDPDQLPEIPGGWRIEQFHLGVRVIELCRPADPDAFLDDDDVARENAEHDYMPYWAFLWPTANRFARWLVHQTELREANVLELGAGIGLAGLAALTQGARVTFSDYDATALHLCRWNSRRNGLPEPTLRRLDWRNPPDGSYSLILGCEVTYQADLHAPLLTTIHRLLAPGGRCWLADPGRYRSIEFYKRALDSGFDVALRDAADRPLAAPGDADYQLMILTRRTSG